MIADSHCHAWRVWPYQPPVPDPTGHGSVDLLLYEMDRHGVERAAVVCARIGDNDDNNEYVAKAAARHPDRLAVLTDVDCFWRPEYHTPGAAARLRATAERLEIAGFTHYVHDDNDGWFRTDEALELFATAAELNLVASLAVSPRWHADLRDVARRFPTLPILVHHLGLARPGSPTFEDDLAEVLASAAVPTIGLKVSGFHYLATRPWDFPFAEGREVFRRLYEAYGAHRLCWGSDFPAARPHVTYTQSLEVVRAYCDFLPAEDLDLILGGTLTRILDTRRPAPPADG